MAVGGTGRLIQKPTSLFKPVLRASSVEGHVEGQVLQSHIHLRPLGVRCEGVGLLCYLTVCIRPVP